MPFSPLKSPFFKRYFSICGGLIFGLLLSPPVQAQLDNSAFYRRLPVNPGAQGEVRLGLDGLGFTKNNEYFNKIADGYTLFGWQVNPRLTYFLTDSIRIDAGVQLRQDFGAEGFREARPSFTLKWQRAHGQLLFGNILGHLNHRYIEPLYDFERSMLHRQENGMQYIIEHPRFWMDTWVEWQRMQYRGSLYQEEVAGGFSARAAVFQSADTSLVLSIPVQFTGQHRGGQIDSIEKPLTTLFNGATGFRLEKNFRHSFFHGIYTENEIVGFLDYSFTRQLPFRQGKGLYLNAGLNTKLGNLMASYWKGHHYIAEMGGRLYQSAGTVYKAPGYREPDRELLILRLLNDIKVQPWLVVTLRFEPVIDLPKGTFEFSHGFYVNFSPELMVAKTRAISGLR